MTQDEQVSALAERAEMLVNRTRKNLKRLGPWARREGVTCYRIYDRDIPEIPLAADWYEGRLHVSVYRRGGDEEGGEFEALAARLGEALGVPRDAVYVKYRERKRLGGQYDKVSDRHERVVVREGGLEFLVNFTDYLDTGLFLDHRRTRALVRAEAEGKRLLNLFSYTGSFSVYAAAGGARSTTSVDLSNTYLGWARDNMELNGFAGGEHRFVRADVLRFLADHRPEHAGYDIVVVDPPTASRSKGMERRLDLQRDHVEILNRSLDLCRPGGAVIFSTNYRKFKLARDELRCAGVRELSGETRPFDFRDTKIHCAFRLEK